MRTALLAAVLACLAACSSDDDGGTPIFDAANADAPTDAVDVDAPLVIDAPAGFTLTSTAFVQGGVIPDLYSCQGANVSPPLAWSGATAPSYAVVLTDLTNNLTHAVIWDIPGTVTSLPEDVMKVPEPTEVPGAKQTLAYDGQTRGYLGPCPPSVHNYQFAVFAVDAATLPGVTLTSTANQVKVALLAHDTASATLTASFTP